MLNDERYRKAAERASEFIFANLNKKGELLHRWRDGEAKVDGMIGDYAFFIYGLIDLYEASFKVEYLNKALELTRKMLELFWDEENGGFFFSAETGKDLIFPYKEIYDGALPSGNSIAAMNLLRLGKFTMNEEFEKKVEAFFRSFSAQIAETPGAYSQALCALDFVLYPSKEIVVAEAQRDKNKKDYIDAIYSDFIPNKIVILRPSKEKELEEILKLIPFVEYQQPK